MNSNPFSRKNCSSFEVSPYCKFTHNAPFFKNWQPVFDSEPFARFCAAQYPPLQEIPTIGTHVQYFLVVADIVRISLH